ncbi:SNF2 family N-terminal domain-containing protein [Dichotomopilus funicola]|uniref:SNF2 family N-terminal domain-containing protein n=1 Tax=Dichotomopilus funicola TaxID=1934379 RepID=A0AAN6ZI90_9PEZI|nr:SNF2 family N-terminal domain-containing protein [Dichotomopilus funicola]
MDPTINDYSASAGPSAADDPFDDPQARFEQLSEELSIQQAVLASLRDLPGASAEEEIAEAEATIGDLKRQLAEVSKLVRRNDRPTNASTSVTNGYSGSSTPANQSGLSLGTSGRKRPLENSHLDVGSSDQSIPKSRRTTPSPASRAFRKSEFGTFSDDDLSQIIDLTGDDDAAWRSTIQRQRKAEERASRIKAETDRDAAFARNFHESSSSPVSGPAFGVPSRPNQTNAFNRILGRSSPSPWPAGHTTQVKPEPGLTLATRPHNLANRTANNPANHSNGGDYWGTSKVKSEPTDHSLRIPGVFVDSDEEGDDLYRPSSSRPSLGTNPQSFRPSLPSLPSLPSFSSTFAHLPPPTASTPTALPPFPRNPGTGIPAIELARQSSIARQEGAVWPPAGPISQLMHAPGRLPESPAGRPGYMLNGSYHSLSGPPSLPPPGGLAATINRVNGYDFNRMLDSNGNPLNERITNFLDDYYNDPRKTDEDIQQLLSNIRPDMDLPEEERGETPDAMKYPLYPHQQLALKWMTDMEEGTNKGGILADDMGLGKTISTLALMVSRPPPDNVRTNLIIGPVALIKQWESEVRKKVKAAHKLSVFLLHSKKRPYSELKRYDVVLTTYGSVAAEWKRYSQHVEARQASDRYREEDDMELAKKCPLLHPKSRFYRVILDEAQCIKNKDTQGSKAVHKINATYRWCLTGTPMMNGVTELYPLIRFLRIRPYNDFKTFQQAFKGLNAKSTVSDYTRDNAMRQLQAILKAMMLRRMKNSMIDGKPILTLPDKKENSEHVVFSDDERQFYEDLESRSQVQFNKFLRAGTIGKNYSNILVLLLRLRQACCHPHLTEFEASGVAVSDVDMLALAKELKASAIPRIKAIEAFECPICYDGVDDPLLIIPCGHDTCAECFASLTENNAQDNLRNGDEGRTAKCPQCREPIQPTKVITLTAFRKVHAPEALPPEEAAALVEAREEVSDSEDSDDYSSDSEDESDADKFGNLAGFVVPDNAGDGDTSDSADLDRELDAAARAFKKLEKSKAKKEAKKAKKALDKGQSSKAEGKKKAKTKEEIQPHMLAQLRNESDRNKAARRRYMHYLRDNWLDSAKVTQVIELLEKIQETGEKTIIFSQWTALLDLIECQIKYKLNLRYCRYTGKMSRNQRDESVQDFIENPRNTVMLVSLRAGNAGLNLTIASRIIICDPFWNPFIEAQAVDRAHRIGQQREVQVHRILVKETVEDRILLLQENKRKLVEAALDEGQSQSLGRLSNQELAYLFGVGSRQ